MGEKKEVIKHSAAIQIENNITLLQRRAWNVLLAYAYDDLPSEEEHRITIATLARVLEFDSKNEDYLKEALGALITCKVEWNILGKDREIEWGATTLLAQAKISNGVCTYAYSPELRRRLHNPRMYARISLSMQNKFDSKHAQALWELCVDALDEARQYGETTFLPLKKYRAFMGIREDAYPLFKLFNKRVIKYPIEEINRITDFHVAAEFKREGRKVTALKFKVCRIQMLPGQATPKQGTLFPDLADMPLAVHELKAAGLASDEAWRIWQEGFAYVDREKRPHNTGDNPEADFDYYVREKIHLLKRGQAEGKIKNSTGFLREAIKKNYANPEFAAEEKQREAREKTKAARISTQERQRLEEQKTVLVRAREDNVHALCERMVKDSPALLEEASEYVFREHPGFRNAFEPEKALLETYQERPMLWVMVDKYLVGKHPERFASILERYEKQLTALEQRKTAQEAA